MDSSKIFKEILPTINSIYRTFKYINLTTEEYERIVLEEIEKSKNDYNGSIDYSKYIRNKIKIELFKIIEELLKDSNESYNLLNNYINQVFKKTMTYEEAVQYINKIDNLFNQVGYMPNPDLVIDLINNNKLFEKAIETIFNKNSYKIISGNYEDIFSRVLFISIIAIAI